MTILCIITYAVLLTLMVNIVHSYRIAHMHLLINAISLALSNFFKLFIPAKIATLDDTLLSGITMTMSTTRFQPLANVK